MPDDLSTPPLDAPKSHRPAERVVVVGAGVGGLAAAIRLAAAGLAVTLVERQPAPGGKMRQVSVPGRAIDAGPTVFTMRWVFEDLFAAAGARFDEHVSLCPAGILARHAWGRESRLDLFADIDRSRDAIAAFSTPAEADRYVAFCRRSARVFEALKRPFIDAQRPNPISLVARAGPRGIAPLMGMSPFATLWTELGRHFTDPRLRQLFGRYATYCGSSPFAASAVLMLVAHVEQDGVWYVDGGMHALARAMASLAATGGVEFRYGTGAAEILVERGRVAGVVLTSGERLAAPTIVFNGDCSAIGSGRLGTAASMAVAPVLRAERSLSALAWCTVAEPVGFPLVRHNVFFSSDYRREFAEIFHDRRLPDEPTVYVCAQDRADTADDPGAPERLLLLVNAPADGDRNAPTKAEIGTCETRTRALLAKCGLYLTLPRTSTTTSGPPDFEALFPATGGALYGRAAHGAMASFRRPGARSRLPGLYLAGGSVHPGPGVPMATLSGRLAADQILADLASTSR